MARIFLAAPFLNKVDLSTRVFKDNKLKKAIEDVAQVITSSGHTVESAHIREDWGKRPMSPGECTSLNYELVKKCDVLIALPGDPPSGGVHIEIGWASAIRKKIILALKYEEQYSPLIEALGSVADVSIIRYSSYEELCQKIVKELNQI